MQITHIRRVVATRCLWWCVAGVLLTALQPFLFPHFRQGGWEDEPGFRIRNAEMAAIFAPGDRKAHRKELETTLYVPAGAPIDMPEALDQGLDGLMALVGLMLPLAVALAWPACPPVEHIAQKPVQHTGGAPPPTPLWRTQPPPTAPPRTP